MYRQTGGQTYQIVYMQVMNGLGVLGFYHAGTFMENNLSPESVADPETD